MTRRRSCCSECSVMSDNFNRANSDDPGEKWIEVNTDVDIHSSKMRLDGQDARAVTVKQHRGAPVIVAALCTNENGDSILPDLAYTIIFQYKDENNYSWVSFITSAGPPEVSTLSIGQVASGVSGSYVQDSINAFIEENVVLDVCYNKTGAFATANDLFPGTYACMPDAGGRKGGLSNPNASGIIYFDNFSLSNHDAIAICGVPCGNCGCDCDYWCVGKELRITLVVISGICTCWDGATADLDYEHTGSEFAWASVLPMPVPNEFDLCDDPDEPPESLFELRCARGGWENWRLCLVDPGFLFCGSYSPSGSCGPSQTEPEISPSDGDCSPFFLEFGPYQCESESGQCTFKFIVTER